MRFLAENIVYPDEALELGIQGKCYARFVVTKKGNVSNVEIIKGVEYCPEGDAEVIRVLKMMPKWKPARNNGKKVNSYYNIPISFIATSSGKREEK